MKNMLILKNLRWKWRIGKYLKVWIFFDIDPEYQVKGEFIITPSESLFTMKKSPNRQPVYVKDGELYFTLKGEEIKLNVYHNQELIKDPEYYDYLFVPFTEPNNKTPLIKMAGIWI